MPLPTQTDEQRKAALVKGSALRRHRAEVKKSLKEGSMSLSDAFADKDCDRMRVNELLRALPGVGPAKAEGIMADLGISAGRRIRGLGTRQREELLRRFR